MSPVLREIQSKGSSGPCDRTHPETPHLTRSTMLSSADGYDRVADFYDRWHWQRFWERNEVPLVGQIAAATGSRQAVDVGVGTGKYLGMLRARGIDGVGVDISKGMLRIACQRLGSRRGLFHADVRAMPFLSGAFNLAVAARVLSHVGNIGAALFELERVLKVGGYLVITDIDGEHEYDATRIATPGAEVRICTFRRGIDQVITEALRARTWRVVLQHRLTARTVPWLPDVAVSRSIDRSGRRPISYVVLFERVSRRHAG